MNHMDKQKHAMVKKIKKHTTDDTRPSYKPPSMESEEIFERRALACGKCRTGPHRQFACMRLQSVS
jgi:hypothetical protein